jgi:hypothetical protein
MERIGWDVVAIILRTSSSKPGYVGTVKLMLIPIENATFTSQNPNAAPKVVDSKRIKFEFAPCW